ETLTNKTLTSPTINSATFGTAATFNATSYTFGTGAAAAFRTALGTLKTTAKYKTTTETRSAATILPDTDLVVALEANKNYEITALVD
ncbi:hypothetical protein U2106_15020, partial [Listeria monocytogenes]|uniref:hypothetical protein n=1 Tax=Listeria monocytogenes TaxID=1639 RepID=UPI002FDC391C